jgi:hypothetical protein
MIDQNVLALLNTIGIWLAGIGILSAVIVSLYLARRDSIVKLKVFAGHRILVTQDQKGCPDFLSIGITNVGFRKITVTGIGWKIGVFNKKYAIQTLYPSAISDNLPKTLNDGDEARLLIPFNNPHDYPNWIDDFPKDFLGKYPKLSSRTLKLQVFTTIGKTFEVKIEPGLRQKLIESALRQKT